MSKKNAKVTGGCLCGEIRYEADTAPYLVGYCHCKMCQKGVGNLFATAAFFKQADFRYIGGDLSWYEAESADRGFCPKCGSPIVFQCKGSQVAHCAIWLGTLDYPGDFEPTAQWHLESKIPWVEMGLHLQDATPTENAGR